MKCHQRIIREEAALVDPRSPQPSLAGCVVEPVALAEAERVILRYEWLRSMPTNPRGAYGLRDPSGSLAGVVCFGVGGGSNARLISGEPWRDRTICLERGACVHWAHPHAGSFLVARACAAAARDYGWRVFYAYSDEAAGEIGTIYQACNWRYIGQSVGRGSRFRSAFISPDGERITSKAWRALRRREGGVSQDQMFAQGWQRDRAVEKHKYVGFYGPRDERRRAERDCRYPPLDYPKRSSAAMPVTRPL